MSACNFEYLLQFVSNQLDLDGQIDVFDHLGRCNICREAVYQLSRELDAASLVYRAQGAKNLAFGRQTEMVRSGRAQLSSNAPVGPAMRRSSHRPR
jgi:hypothetical protein